MPTEPPSDGADDSSDVPSEEQPGFDLVALRALDQAAWTLGFKKLWPLAMMAARRYLKCDADAEEAASEALAQLVSEIHRARTTDDLCALTYMISERRAVSGIRRNSAAKRTADMVSMDDDSSDQSPLIERIAAPEDVLSIVESAERTKLLQQALSELDPDTRQLLEEKILLGKTYEELSAQHQIPLGTACAKVFRGVKDLRVIIENSPVLKKELHGFLR